MGKRILVISTLITLTLGLDYATALAGVGSLAKNKAYSINVIAHDICPAGSRRTIAVLANFTDNPDGTQFATIDKTNKIFLAPGPGFAILDGNACDGDGASLQLPSDVSTTFEVFVRLVGQPNSSVDVSTCGVDTTGALTGTAGIILCSTDHFVKTRLTGKGQPSFTNATSQLLFITNPLLTTVCAGGKCGLFDPNLQDFFWNWNTQGRPHAQLWFVPVQ